jgi:hypothetical protein
MTNAVVAGALAVAGLNAITMVIGAWQWRAASATDRRAARIFWISLRVGQAGALLFAVAVGVLAAAGKLSSERLFYLYALLPLAIAFLAEQLRIASAQTILDRHGLADAQAVGELPAAQQHAIVAEIVHREVGVMALSALVVVFLALRAAETAHF